MALQPDRAAYVSNAAASLAALGRQREACDACITAARLEPRFERARTRLAAVAATPEGFEHALAAALAAVAAYPDRCVCGQRIMRSCKIRGA